MVFFFIVVFCRNAGRVDLGLEWILGRANQFLRCPTRYTPIFAVKFRLVVSVLDGERAVENVWDSEKI